MLYPERPTAAGHTRPHPALSLADARQRAKDTLYAVDRGEDPQAEKQAERQGTTVAELAAEYLERHAKLKSAAGRRTTACSAVDVLPHWKRGLVGISRDMAKHNP